MGMFDSIKIELEIPGLPQEFSEYRGGKTSEIVFQTKDTPDQAVSLYKIGSDGILYVERFEGVWVEGEPLPDEDVKSWNDRLAFLGHYERTVSWWEPQIGFTDDISFYDYWEHPYTHEFGCKDADHSVRYKHGWVEFKARFVNGHLEDIFPIQLLRPLTLSDEEVNKILEETEREETEYEAAAIARRLEHPSSEEKLIDDIDNVLHNSNTCMFDESDLMHKLNNIEDLINTYRETNDRYYTKAK